MFTPPTARRTIRNRLGDFLLNRLSQPDASAPDPTVFQNFVDISRWQTGVPYSVIVSGGWFTGIVKCSEAIYPDPKFTTHWQGFHNAGGLVLVYHFFRGNVDGKAQAQACLSTCAPLIAAQGKVVVFADVESGDGVTNVVRMTRLKDFIDTIEAAGQDAGVYTSPSGWIAYFGPTFPTWINDYWLWIANHTSASLPAKPAAWDWAKTLFWQRGIWPTHSWATKPPGWIAGTIDTNRVFVADRATLENLLGITGSPPPPPPTTLPVVAPVLTKAQVVSTTGLNVRETPSVSGVYRGGLAPGTIVEIAKVQVNAPGDEWAWIYAPSGLYGWSAVVYGGKTYLVGA